MHNSMSRFENIKRIGLKWWPHIWPWLLSMAVCSIPFPFVIKINNMMPPIQTEFLGSVRMSNIYLFAMWVTGVIVLKQLYGNER